MKQTDNSNKLSAKSKDPQLMIRYSRGLGDFISCLLHSKAIGWLTKLITKKDKPCTQCRKRANALNTLFPIPFWKMFFSSDEEYYKNIKIDLEKAGYSVEGSPNTNAVSSSILTRTPIVNNFKNELPIIPSESPDISKYELLSSSDSFVGDFLIKTQVFKTK